MLKKLIFLPVIFLLLICVGCQSNTKDVVTKSDIAVASSIEILQTTTDQMAKHNFDLLSKYMKTGDYYSFPKGTKIRELETRNNKYVKCLILDGKYANKVCWTFKLSFDYDPVPLNLIITK